MARLGYVGLGIMGGPMARHLATAKHSMTVYNRTTAKTDAWVKAVWNPDFGGYTILAVL